MDNTKLLMDLLTTYDKNGEIKDIIIPGKSKKPYMKNVNTKTLDIETVLSEAGRLTYKPIVEKKLPIDTEEAILDIQIKKYEKIMDEINKIVSVLDIFKIISFQTFLIIGYCFDKNTLEFDPKKFPEVNNLPKIKTMEEINKIARDGAEIRNKLVANGLKDKYIKKYFELVKEYFMSIENK